MKTGPVTSALVEDASHGVFFAPAMAMQATAASEVSGERTRAYRYLAGQIRNETGAFWNGSGARGFRNGGGLLVGGGGVDVEGV